MTQATNAAAADAVVAGKHGAPLISDLKLQRLYASVLRASLLSEHLGVPAFEAVFAALLSDLRPGDRVTASPLSPVIQYLSGTPLNALQASHPPKSVASPNRAAQGASPAIATGLALALRQQRPDSMVFAFASQDQLPPDGFRETLRFASQYHLPILYVLLPNRSIAPQHLFDWSADAILEDVPCIPVDARDGVGLYRVTQESTQRARRTGGPTLIDCKLTCLQPGDDDPTARMEAHLQRKELLTPQRRQQIMNQFQCELRQANSAVAVPRNNPRRSAKTSMRPA